MFKKSIIEAEANNENLKKVAIIGGGIAGLAASFGISQALGALYEIINFESRKGNLEGTSFCPPGRVGVGTHYMDLNTACLYLIATIESLKLLGDYRLLDDRTQKPARWTYFVANDSMYSVEEIRAHYKKITEFYKWLCEIDNANKVLGEPEDLIKEIPKERWKEYPHFDENKYCAIFDVGEGVLKWDEFKSKVIEKFSPKKNSTTKFNTKVVSIHAKKSEKNKEGNFFPQYSIRFIENGEEKEETFDIVVNSTWEQADGLNATAGFNTHSNKTTRLKLVIEVTKDMQENDLFKHINSTFVVFGPYCGVTRLSATNFFVSYEPATVLRTWSGNQQIDKSTLQIVYPENANDNLKREENIKLAGKKILEGTDLFMPNFSENARITNGKIGFVITTNQDKPVSKKTLIRSSSFDYTPEESQVQQSVQAKAGNAVKQSIDKRDELGLYQLAPGFFVAQANKLYFAFLFCQLIADMEEFQTLLKREAREIQATTNKDMIGSVNALIRVFSELHEWYQNINSNTKRQAQILANPTQEPNALPTKQTFFNDVVTSFKRKNTVNSEIIKLFQKKTEVTFIKPIEDDYNQGKLPSSPRQRFTPC